MRTVDKLRSSFIPISLSTVESFMLPVLQAAPFDTAIFFLSSFAIIISDLCPGKEMLIKPGSPLSGLPFRFASGKLDVSFFRKYSSKSFSRV